MTAIFTWVAHIFSFHYKLLWFSASMDFYVCLTGWIFLGGEWGGWGCRLISNWTEQCTFVELHPHLSAQADLLCPQSHQNIYSFLLVIHFVGVHSRPLEQKSIQSEPSSVGGQKMAVSSGFFSQCPWMMLEKRIRDCRRKWRSHCPRC